MKTNSLAGLSLTVESTGSGTRDAVAELALEGGCKTFGWIKAMKKQDKKHYKTVCHTAREDRHYIEAGGNDQLIVQKLKVNPNALGGFGFSYLEQNVDSIQGNPINGVAPELETIPEYLAERGLIPMPNEERGKFAADASAQHPSLVCSEQAMC